MAFELQKKKKWTTCLNCDLCGEEIVKFSEGSAYFSWSDEDEKKYSSVVPVYAHSKCYTRLEEFGVPPWLGLVEQIDIEDYVKMLWDKHPLSISRISNQFIAGKSKSKLKN